MEQIFEEVMPSRNGSSGKEFSRFLKVVEAGALAAGKTFNTRRHNGSGGIMIFVGGKVHPLGPSERLERPTEIRPLLIHWFGSPGEWPPLVREYYETKIGAKLPRRKNGNGHSEGNGHDGDRDAQMCSLTDVTVSGNHVETEFDPADADEAELNRIARELSFLERGHAIRAERERLRATPSPNPSGYAAWAAARFGRPAKEIGGDAVNEKISDIAIETAKAAAPDAANDPDAAIGKAAGEKKSDSVSEASNNPALAHLKNLGLDYAGLARHMNANAAVAAQGGAFDITEAQIRNAIEKPQPFGRRCMYFSIIHHRILQTVNSLRVDQNKEPLSKFEFYGVERKKKEEVPELLGLGMDIYDNIMRGLDRDANRHFQTMEQLHNSAGFNGRGAIYNFLLSPEYSYRHNEAKRGEVKPNVFLENIAKSLSCAPHVIVPIALWKRALGPNSAIVRLIPDEPGESVPGISLVYRHLMSVGINDAAILTARMNAYPAVAEKNGEFDVKVSQIRVALENNSPFGMQGVFVSIIHHRIAQVFNEEAAKQGKKTLSIEEFFGIGQRNDKDLSNLRKLGQRIHANILRELDHPYNRHIQTLEHLHTEAGYNASTMLIDLLSNPWRGYSSAKEHGEPKPRPILKKFAAALRCNPYEIMTISQWQEAASLYQESNHKMAMIQPDKNVLPDEVLEKDDVTVPLKVNILPPASETDQAPALAAPQPNRSKPVAFTPISDAFAEAAIEILHALEQLKKEKPISYSLILRIADGERLEPNEDDRVRLRYRTAQGMTAAFDDAMGELLKRIRQNIEPKVNGPVLSSIMGAIRSRRELPQEDAIILESLEGLNGVPPVEGIEELKRELPHLENWSEGEIFGACLRAVQPMARELAAGFKLRAG